MLKSMPGDTRRRFDWEIVLLSLPALIAVLVLFIYPFVFGLDFSLRSGARGQGDWTLNNYSQFFGDERQVDTIWTTFQVALPVTLFSVALSVPLAYFMRRGIKFERLITIILILPITLGTVMVAQAMLSYFGPRGWFNQILQGAGLTQDPIRLTRNWIGVEIALFINGFPFVFLMILGYMSGINPDLERASRMLGASRWKTFWRVIFPLTVPGIAIAFCLNFVANFSVFPSANLVGEPSQATRVISIAAFQAAYDQNNRPLGIAIALVMGVIELAVIAFVLWLRARLARGATLGGGKGV
ncbi:MAG: binding-protein-dependent transport system inner rane Component:tumor necrosis factor [Chloroflexi bacterium]|jgi:putative spermidine/putrescine transport system permease protein|nr:binding-protein-dependent transport system inner rane Component:tumor necrosis factor [Chloroflexota bacterium]